MKRLLSLILPLIAFLWVSLMPPAFADADLAAGGKIFSAKCASCHAGGKNLVNGAKTLSKADLEKYDMYSLEKVVAQVTNGKMAMPSFKSLLSAQEIENVASYVLAQADKGWK
ncbi:cytochrome c6 PetJ [Crocosphaera sp. XPORK-15E]|uniref:cytochrome c6 PetJ n=1 Tax=Crocosphaera sp. XPORK-15E TaxID=3110247 RepID=UPI002B1F9AF3|nr:c-type cytochrome [Crocosphaera sp. XPORK-15E]MEA5533951.1 c-type cytochrome [Crocosphaera sp. XPORK-15E]